MYITIQFEPTVYPNPMVFVPTRAVTSVIGGYDAVMRAANDGV